MHHWVGRGQQRAAVQIHAPTAKRDGPTGLPRALDSAGAQRWVGVGHTRQRDDPSCNSCVPTRTDATDNRETTSRPVCSIAAAARATSAV
jgi:hypothetical protein